MSRRIERVGNAGEVRFDELVVERIEESLIRVSIGPGFGFKGTYWTSYHLPRLCSPCPNQIFHTGCRDSREKTPNPNHDGCLSKRKSVRTQSLERPWVTDPFIQVGTNKDSAYRCPPQGPYHYRLEWNLVTSTLFPRGPQHANMMAFQTAKRDLRKHMRETLKNMSAAAISQQC